MCKETGSSGTYDVIITPISPLTRQRKRGSRPLFPNYSSGKRLDGESCTKFSVPMIDSRIA
jgi:hypothetical protein